MSTLRIGDSIRRVRTPWTLVAGQTLVDQGSLTKVEMFLSSVFLDRLLFVGKSRNKKMVVYHVDIFCDFWSFLFSGRSVGVLVS